MHVSILTRLDGRVQRPKKCLFYVVFPDFTAFQTYAPPLCARLRGDRPLLRGKMAQFRGEPPVYAIHDRGFAITVPKDRANR